MEQEGLQQAALNEALVPIVDQYLIPKYKDTSSYQFQLDNQKIEIGVELFWEILCITLRVPNKEFIEPPPHDALVLFFKQLSYKGKLKFISKGEEDQKYGMSIPDLMMNDDIKKSDVYLTCITLYANTELPKVGKSKGKGKGKGPAGKKKADPPTPKEKKKKDAPRKKSSITTNDNILLDPDKALKLGEFINEEDNRLIQRRPTSVVIGGSVHKVSDEDKLDHSQKLKGIETLSKLAQYILDMKTTSKASKLDYRIQQQSQGSSKGAGIILEVLDEPKGNSGSSNNSSSGSDYENEIISSDDEKKVVDQEKVDDKEKADEEMKNDEEVEKDEKVDDEQAGINQAHTDQAKDDQAGVIILEIQQKKPKVPPTSSSLTLSSVEYGNQFLNDSCDTSLPGILKEPAKIEMQSMVVTRLKIHLLVLYKYNI
ncbi:hypothetical protein Tco_0990745 [Tanacetum coccineum]|uniref:Uncharacterized protein n=1 Tax=Tanacetum coccineum TaxID=301880 RepID=A0ABQ5EXD4_9ASTR